MQGRDTLLGEIARARGEVRRLAKRCNDFLTAHGGAAVDLPDAGPLRLAIYGRYNVGKSTVVNALLGERCAETGDGPTTDEPHAYDGREFHIVDLPGTDARLEDEQRAVAAVREAHAVLYVVSAQGGLEQALVWDDLRFLERRGLPYLVVMNDKQPHETDEAECRWRQDLGSRFRRLADERLGPGRNPEGAYWLNARRAEAARLAGREAWAARSGIVPLEVAVAERFYRNDPILRDLDLLVRLAEALDDVRAAQSQRMESADAGAIAGLLDRLEALRERISAAATNTADARFANLRDALGARLGDAVMASAEEDQAAAEVTGVLQDTFASAVRSLEQRAVAEFEAFVAQLRAVKAGAPVPTIDDSLRISLGDIPHVPSFAGRDDVVERIAAAAMAGTKVYAQLAAAEARAIGALGGGTRAIAASGSRAAARTAAAEAAAVEGGAARGAGSMARFIGGALIVALAAWEIHRGFQQAKAELRARELACQEAAAKAAHAVSVARDEFLGRAATWLTRATGPIEAQLRTELETRARRRSSAEAVVARAAELAGAVREHRARLLARTRGSEEES